MIFLAIVKVNGNLKLVIAFIPILIIVVILQLLNFVRKTVKPLHTLCFKNIRKLSNKSLFMTMNGTYIIWLAAR